MQRAGFTFSTVNCKVYCVDSVLYSPRLYTGVHSSLQAAHFFTKPGPVALWLCRSVNKISQLFALVLFFGEHTCNILAGFSGYQPVIAKKYGKQM